MLQSTALLATLSLLALAPVEASLLPKGPAKLPPTLLHCLATRNYSPLAGGHYGTQRQKLKICYWSTPIIPPQLVPQYIGDPTWAKAIQEPEYQRAVEKYVCKGKFDIVCLPNVFTEGQSIPKLDRLTSAGYSINLIGALGPDNMPLQPLFGVASKHDIGDPIGHFGLQDRSLRCRVHLSGPKGSRKLLLVVVDYAFRLFPEMMAPVFGELAPSLVEANDQGDEVIVMGDFGIPYTPAERSGATANPSSPGYSPFESDHTFVCLQQDPQSGELMATRYNTLDGAGTPFEAIKGAGRGYVNAAEATGTQEKEQREHVFVSSGCEIVSHCRPSSEKNPEFPYQPLETTILLPKE